MDIETKGKILSAVDAAFKWIADQLSHAVENPKTTVLGVSMWVTIPGLPTWQAKLTAFLAGLGLVAAHDAGKGSSKETVVVDKAVDKVEALHLPEPPTKDVS